ncbi:MAG: glycerol-3-phosphate dehydrogenase [Actinomycetota bacterium]
MATVAVLGAGAMGSALATPAVAAGNRVRLWGTWLDGGLLAELRAGRPHPRTGAPVDPRVELHDAGDLAAALDDADLVAVAISSDGVLEVAGRAAGAGLAPGTPLLLCTKGFGRRPDGGVGLLPDLVAAARVGRPAAGRPVVAVGGPCKANEVAAGRPTAAVFAGEDRTAVERCARAVATPAYRVQRGRDPVGVEAAAATKNVYAIAVGLCHGLGEAGGQPWHDLAAATFTQAVAEMGRLAVALGGRQETVLGLAGLGDLESPRCPGATGCSGPGSAGASRPPRRWPPWPPPARPSRASPRPAWPATWPPSSPASGPTRPATCRPGCRCWRRSTACWTATPTRPPSSPRPSSRPDSPGDHPGGPRSRRPRTRERNAGRA